MLLFGMGLKSGMLVGCIYISRPLKQTGINNCYIQYFISVSTLREGAIPQDFLFFLSLTSSAQIF